MLNQNNFRHDINALRALAVTAVVLFHFEVPGFEGGFVGVDVFFVISGFLMTQIITRRLSAGRFNLLEFYLDRGRRIVPALAVMVGAVLAFGWNFLTTVELQEMATEAKFALLFLSNELFSAQSGYFDNSATSKWMLHTWSLSVEWQFYMVYPVVVWATWVLAPKRISAVVTAIFVLSVGWLLLQPDDSASFAFYSLTTRAWEMATGSLVFLYGDRFRRSALVQTVGFCLIALSIGAIDEGPDWPGILTVIPVLGCALVIAAGSRSPIPRVLFLAAPIGSASYSIYLWHWPIVAALHYFMVETDSIAIGAGIVASFALGAVSYRCIEIPTQRALGSLGTLKKAAVISTAAFFGIQAASFTYRSADDRTFPADVRLAEQSVYDFNPRRDDCLLFSGLDMPRCRYGDISGKLQAVVYGDSHADAVVTAVAAAQPAGGYVEEWSYASCPTIFGANLVIKDRPCPEFNEWARRTLRDLDPDVPVIIANRFASYPVGDEGLDRPYIYFSREVTKPDAEFLQEYREHFISTMCDLGSKRPVYLLRPVPEMPYSVPSALVRSAMLSNSITVGISREAYDDRAKIVADAQDAAAEKCGVKILDTAAYLCTRDFCPGGDGGKALYFDNSHLSEAGNRKLIPMFLRIFK